MNTMETGRTLENGWMVVAAAEDEDEGIVIAIAPYVEGQEPVGQQCRYATWYYRTQDNATVFGHYHATWSAAVKDYEDRKREYQL